MNSDNDSNLLKIKPNLVKVCAGEGGLRSWEWCGGGGVDWSGGKRGRIVWREKRVDRDEQYVVFKRGKKTGTI
nr:hypothetical protein [Tanacetum cinerariifolium]